MSGGGMMLLCWFFVRVDMTCGNRKHPSTTKIKQQHGEVQCELIMERKQEKNNLETFSSVSRPFSVVLRKTLIVKYWSSTPIPRIFMSCSCALYSPVTSLCRYPSAFICVHFPL
jgi:hypothetical protein